MSNFSTAYNQIKAFQQANNGSQPKAILLKKADIDYLLNQKPGLDGIRFYFGQDIVNGQTNAIPGRYS